MTPLLLALLFQPASPAFEGLTKQAAAARDQNRLEDAANLYRRTLKLRPAWAEGWWFLGAIRYDQDRYAEARDALRRFHALAPKDVRGLALLGLCEYETGEYAPALRHLMRARAAGLGADPAMNNVALYHAALLLTREGEFETALSILTGLARQGDAGPSMVEAAGLAGLRKPLLPAQLPAGDRALVNAAGRAICAAARRDAVEAERAFAALAADYPGAPNVHYAYASYLLSANPEAAVSELQKELAISPQHVPALVSIALEYQKRGESEEGRAYAERAVALEPASFAARVALGKILLDQGDAPGAIAALEAAVSLAPDSPQVRMALASAYAKAGRNGDAAAQRAEFMKLQNRGVQ